MIKAQVRATLSGLRAWSAFAARADRVVRPRHADQATGLAANGTRRTAIAAVKVAVVQPLPDRLAVEHRIHPDENKGQRQERVDAGHEPDRHQIAELYIGDKHAEDEDLDHRPRAQPLG